MRRGIVYSPEQGFHPADGATPPPPASAYVTCHNYARYLRQCVESLVTQTEPFVEIVIVDDASDDETPSLGPALAAQYDVVSYKRINARSRAVARNVGHAATSSPLVVSVDADNWLGPTWLADARSAAQADADAAIFFSAPSVVNDAGAIIGKPSYVRPYDYHALRRANHIDNCALVRRVAINQVGGWLPMRDEIGMEDWHLWLRITRVGWGAHVQLEPNWFYRAHDAQVSRVAPRGYAENRKVMADTFHLAVVMPMSGRAWMLEKLPGILALVGWPAERTHGIFVDNSRSALYRKELGRQIDASVARDWASVSIVNDPTESNDGSTNDTFANDTALRLANLEGLSDALCRIYARTVQRLLGEGVDIVLTIEDDIEPIGDNVALRLFDGLEPNVMAVSGVVMSRFITVGSHHTIITFDVEREDPYSHKCVVDKPGADGFQDVGATGMGCLLTRAEAWHRHMPRRIGVNDSERDFWHDMAFSANVRRAGYQWRLNWGVRTRHYSEDGTWV